MHSSRGKVGSISVGIFPWFIPLENGQNHSPINFSKGKWLRQKFSRMGLKWINVPSETKPPLSMNDEAAHHFDSIGV